MKGETSTDELDWVMVDWFDNGAAVVAVRSGIFMVARTTKRIRAAMMTVQRECQSKERKGGGGRGRTDEKGDDELLPPVDLRQLRLPREAVLEILLRAVLLSLDVAEAAVKAFVVVAGRRFDNFRAKGGDDAIARAEIVSHGCWRRGGDGRGLARLGPTEKRLV